MSINPVRRPAAAAGSTTEDMLRRLEFPGQLCGTVCRLRFVHRTRHWTYLKINWKFSSSELCTECAFAALANLRGINYIIIIINQSINITPPTWWR